MSRGLEISTPILSPAPVLGYGRNRFLARQVPRVRSGHRVPYLAWVQYREEGNTRGQWSIRVHDLRSSRERVAADWRDLPIPSRAQPSPLPSIAEGRLVWNSIELIRGERRLCIKLADLESLRSHTVVCDSAKAFPH